jgi:hypothetical protein
VLSTVLHWRHVLPAAAWELALSVLALVAISAWLFPPWFRGYYRFSNRLGFYLTRVLGCVVLAVFFLLFVTPLGLVLRLLGKDLLQVKDRRAAATAWQKAGESTPLDSLF